MEDVSEKEWKPALTSILEELDKMQYRKMLQCLDKIPQSMKTGRSREKMPQKIIEIYGFEGSVIAIHDAMEQIPRRDAAVQDLLRPFVNKVKNKNEERNTGRKRECDPDEKENNPAAGKKTKYDPVKTNERPDEGPKPQPSWSSRMHMAELPTNQCKREKEGNDQKTSYRPDEETTTRPWKKSIRELKSSSELHDTDVIVGKVVQKSHLRSYRTQDNKEKSFFYLGVADKTDSLKIMVYGEKYHKKIEEGKSYLFRKLLRDDQGVKFNSLSKCAETKPVSVPEEIEVEARELINPKSPVYSIAEIKSSPDGTLVTVEGTVTENDGTETVPVSKKEKKVKRQSFQLKDDTGAIRICMWDDQTKQSKRLSVGDVITVTNVRIHWYCDNVSLNSTGFTKIDTLQHADIQNVTIEIVGITEATKREIHLEAEFNEGVHTLIVTSKRLAAAFDFELDGNIKKTLLGLIPLKADAVIRGNKIKKLTAA